MSRFTSRRLVAFALCALVSAGAAMAQQPSAAAGDDILSRMSLPAIGLRARDLAVVVNDADSTSVEIGRYYARQRGISAAHVIHVSFAPGGGVMSFADFVRVQAVLDAKVGPEVQGYALAWTVPYRVECMSVTAAFAFGFDPASYCGDQGCQTTKASPYFNSNSNAPYTDHKMRPAMLLAGNDVDSVKRLIDRGLRSDERWPEGKAYLMNTSDGARNVRSQTYERVRSVLGPAYPIEQVDGDRLEGKSDVMFEFTGLAIVPGVAANRFLDGAIADHLTSHGGNLTGSGQTIATEWLAAGATGSYGASTEPCNYRAKFPDVGLVMARYLTGETLLEAYWKSVLMPGQGVFVGDPLARPFGGVRVTHTGMATVLETRALRPGRYVVEAARGSIGPFAPVGMIAASGFVVRKINLPSADTRYYRLRAVPQPQQPASAAAPASDALDPVAAAAPAAPASAP